jgi:hypothetical protein
MRINFTANFPKYLRVYTHFVSRELGIDKLRGEINLFLKKDLDSQVYGLCWGDNRECFVEIATKQWGMPVSREDKYKTIAHELVHCRQYLTRKLRPSPQGDFVSRWNGRNFKYDPKNEEVMPWEKEAQKVEQKMYDLWIEKTGYI